jgi:hypothetical protein
MHSLALLLKSYGGDADLAERMLASFNVFNAEGLPLYVVVPDAAMDRFSGFASEHVTVLPESRLGEYLVDHDVAGVRPGYINQEIIKLSFWELQLADNYFCIDSDAVFVRPFGRDDFMYDDTTPYTVLVEDNELKVEPRYYAQHWQGRETNLRRIQGLVGLEDRRILTCHGHQVFSSRVLRSLKEDFLRPRGWSYADMLAEAPYEFTWYNMWLQKTKIIPIEIREPLVKVFHHEGQEIEYALRGVTPTDIARGYVAVVVNSNYARSWAEAREATTAEDVLARYVPYDVLMKALTQKVRDTAARRFRG